MPRFIAYAFLASVLAILVSPTAAGFILRATLTVPLYWLGVLDGQTVENLAINGHF